jgi:DNA-directed RNA polymerase subunit RPC12/RpoP
MRPPVPDATLYRCARCRREFVAAPIAVVRQATGGRVSHCGTTAWFVRNLTAEEAAQTTKRGGNP